MSRSAFLKSLGASHRNRLWSWSAVNHEIRFIIFGAWEEYEKPEGILVLSEDWVVVATSGISANLYA